MLVQNQNEFLSQSSIDKLMNCNKKKRLIDELNTNNNMNTSPSHQSLKRQRHDAPQLVTTRKVKESTVGLQFFQVNDVLSGRGGGTNQHEGNCYFRTLIDENREKYLRAKKNDKPFISLSIVRTIRETNGRFLKKRGDLWFEIGDAAAREKTSQALRQRAPAFKKLLIERDAETLRSLNASPMQPLMPPISAIHTAHSLDSEGVKSGYNSAKLMVLNSILREAQLQEARYALRLQQKLRKINLLEMYMMSA